MNEFYFVLQVVLVLIFTYGAFRLGKNALITAVTVQALIANLFVLKQISLFSFSVTCSDAYAVGSIFGLNLLREYFDRKSAKKAISICFFFLAFFVIMSQLHLRFIPNVFDSTQNAYTTLLTPAPQLLIASLVAFFIVQHFDIRFFELVGKMMPKSSFPVRSSLSLTISQLLDTVLFSFLGLFGILANITHIVLVSFLIKVLIIALLGPLMSFFRRLERHV